jgi:hypothetical protein
MEVFIDMNLYKEELVKLIDTGKKLIEIIEIVGYSRNTVLKYMKLFEIATPPEFYSTGKKRGRPAGFYYTEEELKAMSERMKGEKNPFFGKKHTKDSLLKMRTDRKDISGENNPFKKSLSNPENRIKHRERCCETWSNRSENEINNITKSKFKGYEEISGEFWKRIQKNAESRNLIFDIDIKDAWSIFLSQNRKCALTGIELKFGHNARSKHLDTETTASLDRIDNDKGYIKNNIQWTHKHINLMRGKRDIEYFKFLCEKVTDYERSKKINE